MLLDKILFVLFFFFAGFFITALVSFVVIFFILRKRKARDGGSLLTIGAAAIGGIGGLISCLVAIVLVVTNEHQWLKIGSVTKTFLYVMGGLIAIGFIKGFVQKLRENTLNKPSKKK